MSTEARLISAVKASALHLALSMLVAGACAVIIFGVWYPWPLSEMLGGRSLFWLIVSVDVMCGPLLTLVVWNPAKGRAERIVDMGLIVAVQLAALIYGIHTMAMARPAYLVFEVDRIRVVSVSEIEVASLREAAGELGRLSWTGPKLISVRPPRNNDELIFSVDLSMAGLEPSLRPGWWQEYALAKAEVLQRAQPLDLLMKKRPTRAPLLRSAAGKTGVAIDDLRWLPLTSKRDMDWIVLLHKDSAEIRGYAKVDGFF